VVSSCQRVWSQERSYPPVFPWISLSIHLGGVKWIIISGKDFDIPGWIKRFLCICNYVEELLWFWNQKFSSCMTQVCLYESLIFVKSASSWYQRQFNSSLPCPFLCCQAWNHCLPKLKLLQFPPSPLMCFMLVISIDVYEHSFHELTMRYSIF
jgi:hypothetical protein